MLISCVMVTRPERAWCLPLAVQCWLAQRHEPREMVIVSDGPVRAREEVAPNIRFLQVPGQHSVGWKRNEAIARARGDLIATWDDDDWSSLDRLSVYVEALLSAGADVAGSTTMLFHELIGERRTLRYRYPGGRPYVVGGTMVYRRSAWERAGRYPDKSKGEDSDLAYKLCRGRVALVEDDRHYVAMVHRRGQTGRTEWDPRPDRFRPAEVSAEEIMGAAALRRYEEAFARAINLRGAA